MTEAYINLDEKDFRCLIRGGVLTIQNANNNNIINIILKDIGFFEMEQALEDAQSGKEKIYENLLRK